MRNAKSRLGDLRPYLPGAGLIGLGLLFLIWPLLLVIIVSAALVTAGVAAIGIGHELKKGRVEVDESDRIIRVRVRR